MDFAKEIHDAVWWHLVFHGWKYGVIAILSLSGFIAYLAA